MSGWDFDEVGGFPSEKDAEDWAKDNGIALTDVDIKTGFTGKTRVWVRRGSTRMSEVELPNSRGRAFF